MLKRRPGPSLLNGAQPKPLIYSLSLMPTLRENTDASLLPLYPHPEIIIIIIMHNIIHFQRYSFHSFISRERELQACTSRRLQRNYLWIGRGEGRRGTQYIPSTICLYLQPKALNPTSSMTPHICPIP